MKAAIFLLRSTLLLGFIMFFTNCEKEILSNEALGVDEELISVAQTDTLIKKAAQAERRLLEDATIEKEQALIDVFQWCFFVPNLTGYYRANDGGHYYVRQVGNKVLWFGEHPSGAWANVFKGEINGRTITGGFMDVPKGRIAGRGGLNLSVNCSGTQITKTLGANFGGSVWTKTRQPSYLPPPRSAGFGVRNTIDDITARWVGNDGGYYYIRQYRTQVFWFGERNFLSGRPAWSNIAVGSRFGYTLWLDWFDVPKGNTTGTGILRIQIDDANSMTSVNATGGFGGSSWVR